MEAYKVGLVGSFSCEGFRPRDRAARCRCSRHFATVAWNPDAGDMTKSSPRDGRILHRAPWAFGSAGPSIPGKARRRSGASLRTGRARGMRPGREQAAMDAGVKGLTGLGERRLTKLRWRSRGGCAAAAARESGR